MTAISNTRNIKTITVAMFISVHHIPIFQRFVLDNGKEES